MAPSILSTSFRKNRKNTLNKFVLWSVTVQDFEGEELEFEVFADTESDASEEAVRLAAAEGMHDIYNTFIYKY